MPKILIACIHYQVASGRYYADAFRRLGCDVRTVGTQLDAAQIWQSQPIPEKYNWQPDGGFDAHWTDWTPDVIILADSAIVGYQHPYYRNTPHIVVSVDNHVRNVEQDGIEAYFLAHWQGLAYPVNPDNPKHHWLPCATDTERFTPSPIAWDDREYDVCMVGVIYPQRRILVDMLRALGFKVFAETALLYDEYRDAYHNARFSLVQSAAGDLAQRFFETAGMECHVLTDFNLMCRDDMLYSHLGLHGFTVYHNPGDLMRRMIEYRDTPEMQKAKAGALNLAAVVRSRHRWIDRAKVILDWLSAYQNQHQLTALGGVK